MMSDIDPDTALRHLVCRLAGLGLGILIAAAASHASPPGGGEQAIPDTPAGRLLASWLAVHNGADEAAIAAWMRASFSPAMLDKMSFGDHLAFYREATAMFGRLHPRPHKIVERAPHRLVVQLLSVEVVGDPEPDPTQVILVEVDVDPDDPRFLARGLGLGSLACAIHEDGGPAPPPGG